MASRIVSSDGSGSRSSRARAVINIPGVQKPHCRPWHCMKPSWTGSSLPSTSRPSTVRTACPEAIAASIVQDFTGSPSTSTTQVPQLEVSQPQCVPVSPSSSRRKCTSSVRGSTSAVTGSPLTVMFTCISESSIPLWPCSVAYPLDGGTQCPDGQFGGQVPLVVCAAAHVGHRFAGLGGGRTRRGERLLRGRLANHVLRQRCQPLRVGGDGRQAHARGGDGVAFQGDLRTGGRHRPVPNPALHLRVRARRVEPQRNADLHQHLVVRQRGFV